MAQPKATNSKQASLSAGKRKLDFEDASKTLLNKIFFLDLQGKDSEQLEQELTMRGAKVEKFFHRDVKYVITTRACDDSRSTPSPLTPSQGRGVSMKSPLESVSPRPQETANKPATRAHSRAAQMLAASQKKTGSKKTVDVIAKAKSWGCKVISLDALLAELKKLKPLPSRLSGGKGRGPCGRVHMHQAPYVKVEDQSRGYRPLVHTTKAWPRPSTDTSPNGCPFDSPKKSKSTARTTSPHGMVTRLKKSGYCECCSVRYEDLSMHLRSGKHLEYANDDSNFTALDKLISQGTRYNEFISQLRCRARSPAKNSPVRRSPCNESFFVTPPSPARPTTPNKNKTTPTRQSPRKRLQSPRGRRSPRFNLTRDGMALRHSPQKRITLPNGAFTSPRTGELRITPTPLKSPAPSGKEYTPGFATPTLESPRLNRKRVLEDCVDSERKRVRVADWVPETPEKMATRSSPHSPACQLANLEAVLERARRMSPTAVRDLVTRESPSTSGNTPSPKRKSPRLKKSSKVKKSLIVSYNLRQLKGNATPTFTRPISCGITPEIGLQGDVPTTGKWSKVCNECPLTALLVQHLFESSGSESSFNGFSPSVMRQAYVQLPVCPLTKTTLSNGSRKRARSAERDVCVGNMVSPDSKKRKVAARKSPRKQ